MVDWLSIGIHCPPYWGRRLGAPPTGGGAWTHDEGRLPWRRRGPKVQVQRSEVKIPGRKSLVEVGVPGAKKRVVSRTSAVGSTRSTSIARTRNLCRPHHPTVPPSEKGECRWFDSIYEHGANPEQAPTPCKSLMGSPSQIVDEERRAGAVGLTRSTSMAQTRNLF